MWSPPQLTGSLQHRLLAWCLLGGAANHANRRVHDHRLLRSCCDHQRLLRTSATATAAPVSKSVGLAVNDGGTEPTTNR